MVRYHITVMGLVQEVGFRFFVYHAAVKYGLSGWVLNSYDGSVELEVQGKRKSIDQFKAEIISGNGLSRIDDITSTLTDIREGEKGFKIIH